MFLVKTMKETLELNVSGTEIELKLSWYNGMVGAVPVFSTLEEALDYADGDASKVIEVAEQK